MLCTRGTVVQTGSASLFVLEELFPPLHLTVVRSATCNTLGGSSFVSRIQRARLRPHANQALARHIHSEDHGASHKGSIGDEGKKIKALNRSEALHICTCRGRIAPSVSHNSQDSIWKDQPSCQSSLGKRKRHHSSLLKSTNGTVPSDEICSGWEIPGPCSQRTVIKGVVSDFRPTQGDLAHPLLFPSTIIFNSSS